MVLSVVNLAAGSFFDNVCDHVANRLKHGDCIDEKCRQLVVRELDEIKTKLDGLARKDLQTSICFLKDGLYLLNCIFEDAASESENDATENKLAHVKECLVIDGKGDLPWKQPDETLKSEIAILNKALSRSSQTLTVEASERFVNAKLSFENAYLKATEAFTNEALSTTERILATKLRVVSKILHCLEDPVMAIAFCKLYLQQLHELPAVKKRYVAAVCVNYIVYSCLREAYYFAFMRARRPTSRPYSKSSLTLNEWRFNVSFPRDRHGRF